MAKLPKENQFLDLSDYGRPAARLIAQFFKPTFVTPIHVTILFIISGLLAIGCIFFHQYLLAAFFIILKSILDAADGELARIKNTPSYTGRYFDSVADIILNFFFLLSICIVTNGNFFFMIFCLPMSSMPLLISKPIILLALVFASAIAKSPVPVAISSMDLGLVFSTSFTTFFRHFTSMPKEMTLFKPS